MPPITPLPPTAPALPTPGPAPHAPEPEPSVVAAPAKVPEAPDAPVQPGLGPEAPTGNVLIARMKVQADLSQESAMPRGPERRQAVFDDLVATAKTSQVDALAKLGELQKSGQVTAVESLFLPNAIMVTTKPGSHQAVADALAGVANVSAVAENKTWAVQGQRGDTHVG
ncbi:MAG: hypothetical protein JWM98_114, partial [Thermoleophilia bacterium]|nr:hypothetical protein [Thermoleophilia bacterium]